MLAEACISLSQRMPVLLVARRLDKLERLSKRAEAVGGEMYHLPLDYSDPAAVKRIEQRLLELNLTCSLTLLWVHAHASSFTTDLVRHLFTEESGISVIEILGSASSQPAGLADQRLQQRDFAQLHHYRQVILGFERENGSSRWLSDAEICEGTLTAIDGQERRLIVGRLSPWEQRPGGADA